MVVIKIVLSSFLLQKATCFTPTTTLSRYPPLALSRGVSSVRRTTTAFAQDNDDDDDDDEKKVNPFQDPNYPDLEFVDYSDPEYVVDQGIGDEFVAEDTTEAEIEAMREDRRRRNDEFQFETYFETFLKKGEAFNGEWTIYKTSTFLGLESDENGHPRLVRAQQPIKVTSSAYRVELESESNKFRVDGSRICHEEVIVKEENDNDTDDSMSDEDKQVIEHMAKLTEDEIMGNKYWPDQLSAIDFRGEQGIMVVGNGHTICSAVPLLEEGTEEGVGPYSEMRTEMGIWDGDLRMRVKFDYSVIEAEKKAFQDAATTTTPPLHLKSMTVCREARGRWPKNSIANDDGMMMLSEEDLKESEILFGIPGGELYDPPLVGSDEQAEQYMLVGLDGGATVLFPYLMNQDPDAFNGKGWVTSLDWSPSAQRYQLDRKVKGGKDILGLRTLELSEVQSADAKTYQPRDGGADMRQ